MQTPTKPIIVLDCDDVLLDWREGFMRWMKTLRGIELDPNGPRSWNMDKWVGEPAMPFVVDFNKSMTFANLKPMYDARKAVASLYAAGYKLHVVTSCGASSSLTARWRERNLDACFGDVFSSLTCLDMGQSKQEALKALKLINPLANPVYVEDNIDHANAAADLGYETYMVRRRHNTSFEGQHDGHCWRDGLGEVASLICGGVPV